MVHEPAVAVMDVPRKKAAGAAPSAELESLRKQHRSELEAILRDLEKLTARVRQHLG
jgi:Skp family chaperone for outer membrane proteins